MKRALVCILSALALAACDDPAGLDGELARLGIPSAAAPVVPVGDPAAFQFSQGYIETRLPVVPLKVQSLAAGDEVVVSAEYTTRTCSSMDASADRSGGTLTLRVVIGANALAYVCVEGYDFRSYAARLQDLPAGTYHLRVIHEDFLLGHTYLAHETTLTVGG